MKRISVLFLCLCATFFAASAQATTDALKQVDALYDADRFDESKTILLAELDKAAAGTAKAEVLWRLSRNCESLGGDAITAKVANDKVQAIFAEGESYADKAIVADAKSYNAYYWKAANAGRWAETKGILDSLFKAGPMKDACVSAININPDFADAYFLLGQLYHKAPGWPLSFGDVNMGVNFARMGMDLMRNQIASGVMKVSYDYSLELANALWTRNWDAKKRQDEKKNRANGYNSAKTAFDKGANYEAVAVISPLFTDRQESENLLRSAIKDLQGLAAPTHSQKAQLTKGLKFMKDFGLK